MRIFKILPSLLFALIFLGGGLFFMWQSAGTTFVNWQAMQSWQASQATLLQVSGGNNKTVARYRYQVAGVSYESERVYVAKFNDNIGDYQQKLLKSLLKMHTAHQIISIWVNPHNPNEAVIDRNMRWGLFALMVGFCSIFVLIGLLVVIFTLKPNKKQSPKNSQKGVPSLTALRSEWQATLKDANNKETFVEFRQRKIQASIQFTQDTKNEQSWQTRKGWQTASIRSGARHGLWVAWGVALLVVAIVVPLAFHLFEDMTKEFYKGNYAILLVLLFPLVSALLLYRAIKTTLEYQRFGKVLFNMDPYPGAIGGHVGGQIIVPTLPYEILNAPASECLVRLECVYSFMSGSGDKRSRHENIRWAQQGQPKVARSGKGVSLGFRFDIPEHLHSSDVVQKEAYNFWRLTVKADVKGIDLNREYNIPVFKGVGGIKTSRHVRHDISAQQEKRQAQEASLTQNAIAQGDFDIAGLSRAMRAKKQGDELHLSFSMFRNKFLIIMAAIFTGGFGFASISMIMMAISGGVWGVIIGLISVPFLLVAVLAAIAFVYMSFNNLRVIISAQGVSVLRRLLFIPIFKRQLSSQKISHLSIKRTGSTGSGVDKVEHFKIFAHDKKGKTVTLAEDIDGEVAAEHFKMYLQERLNRDH